MPPRRGTPRARAVARRASSGEASRPSIAMRGCAPPRATIAPHSPAPRIAAVARRDRLPQRVPAVPGPAPARQAHPAVVRRRGDRVDAVHGVLPARAAAGLRLRARPGEPRARRGARCWIHRGAARREPRLPAARTGRGVEAAGWRQPGRGHPRAALRDGGAALLPALLDQPAGAVVVRARMARVEPLSPVRALQPRLDAGAAGLSVPVRALVHRARAVAVVVRRLRALRRAVRHARVAQPRPPAAHHRGRPHRGHRQRAAARAVVPRALGHALGHGVGDAARGREPPHAEHPVDPAPLGRAARGLPAHVHPLLRERPLVPSRALPGEPRVGAVRDGLVPGRQAAAVRAGLARGGVHHRALLRVHVLPRRARAPPAGAAPPHPFLPRGVAGRRRGRRAGGHRGAGDAAGLPRARHRRRRGGLPRAGAQPAPAVAVRGADGRGGLGHLRGAGVARAQLHRGHDLHRAQLLRRAAREGAPERPQGPRHALPLAGARLDPARRAVAIGEVPSLGDDVLQDRLGHRPRADRSWRASPSGWR